MRAEARSSFGENRWLSNTLFYIILEESLKVQFIIIKGLNYFQQTYKKLIHKSGDEDNEYFKMF